MPHHRDEPDELLLADLRRVSAELNTRALSISAYHTLGQYSGPTYCRRYGSWKAALALVDLEPAHLWNVSKPELLKDIRLVFHRLGNRSLSRTDYLKHSRYSVRILQSHFASWQDAADAARVTPAYRRPVDDRALFDNLQQLWTRLGRQPKSHEVKKPLSRFSLDAYLARFNKFNHALRAFAQHIDPTASPPPRGEPSKNLSRKTTRHVNDRLRFKVMRRDRFRCCACGRSPATHVGITLVIDHKKPWRHGGETVMSNLQTLCKQCNGGKSDLTWRCR